MTILGSCDDTDYAYNGDLTGPKTIPGVTSWTVCGKICQARSTCKIWQWDKYNLECRIAFASKDNTKVNMAIYGYHFVSGDEECPGKKIHAKI